MFHRFGGKAFFFVLALLFLGLSVQNTWQFLVTVLPDATPFFIGCMMIVFEGGLLGWLALLMHGSENIPRTIIAALMLVVTGAGVATGAYFELDGQMHKSIAVKIDPGFLANVPNIVNGVYLATFVAIVLYILANPQFHARMKHMNTHGNAPTNMKLISLAQTQVTPEIADPQTKAIAAPAQSLRQRAANFIAGNKMQQIAAPVTDADPAVAAEDGKRGCHYCGEVKPGTWRKDPIDGLVPICRDCIQRISAPPQQAQQSTEQEYAVNTAPFSAAPQPNGAKLNGK